MKPTWYLLHVLCNRCRVVFVSFSFPPCFSSRIVFLCVFHPYLVPFHYIGSSLHLNGFYRIFYLLLMPVLFNHERKCGREWNERFPSWNKSTLLEDGSESRYSQTRANIVDSQTVLSYIEQKTKTKHMVKYLYGFGDFPEFLDGILAYAHQRVLIILC